MRHYHIAGVTMPAGGTNATATRTVTADMTEEAGPGRGEALHLYGTAGDTTTNTLELTIWDHAVPGALASVPPSRRPGVAVPAPSAARRVRSPVSAGRPALAPFLLLKAPSAGRRPPQCRGGPRVPPAARP